MTANAVTVHWMTVATIKHTMIIATATCPSDPNTQYQSGVG